ncbi:MAG: hypothetical protein U0744_16100 [Gemmataceae bacterium]
MAIKQRLLKAEKRCPKPAELEWPGIQPIMEEWDRMRAWLAEKGLTAEEAHRRGLKVPGNRFVQSKAEIEVQQMQAEWKAKEAVKNAEFVAQRQQAFAAGRTSSVTQPGESPCTSNSGDPAS